MPDTTLPDDAPEGAAQPAAAFDFDARFHMQFELARGGMGRVLVAQDSVLRREVAVKELLKKDNARALRRFEREALLTARLQHPGIVSVYELARRTSGEPVLVMRRVQGEPLEDAIAAARSLEKRLALLSAFISTCDAVAYAHQQGVIHRDLKPGNVLLGDFGDTVVIDWGLAKDLNDAQHDDSSGDDEPTTPGFGPPLTAAGAVLGTPAYMAPEQARGEPADARSDVYALGAILYHLVSGKRPYQGADSKQVLEAVRRGPPLPVSELVPGLAPELSTIIGQAIAWEPRKRYKSARELSEELKRFQNGRLVLSHTYRTRDLVLRWARRHAAVLAVSAASLLLLAIGGVVSVRRVLAERDRAGREAESAQRVSQFMIDMFSVSDPGEARGRSVTAREILETAAKDVDKDLAKDPIVQARLMDAIGRVYLKLGLFDAAQPLLSKALDLRRAAFGPEHTETQASMQHLGWSEFERGRYAEAEKLEVALVEIRRRTFGPDHPETLSAMNNLAVTYSEEHRPAEAEKITREMLDIRRRTLGPLHADTLRTLSNLAGMLLNTDRFAEAEPLYREASESRRRVLGADHPGTLTSTDGLAQALLGEGRFVEAEKLLREVLEARRRVLGPKHPRTLNSTRNLATVLGAEGRHGEAEAMLREALEVQRGAVGKGHPDTLRTESELGMSLARQGKFAAAEETLRRVLEIRRSGKGHIDADAASTLYKLGGVAALKGDRTTALGRLREAVPVLAASSPGFLDQVAKDDDLKSLRGDPELEKLLKSRGPARW